MLPVDASPYGECDLFVVGGFIAWHVKRIVWIVALGQVSFRFNGILDEDAYNLKFFFDSTLALMVLYVVWVCIVTCSSARAALPYFISRDHFSSLSMLAITENISESVDF